MLCGGAGLVLAQALIFPGRNRRLDNLARKGREAGVVALGAVMMFFVAALIEGIFRQVEQRLVVRYLMIAFTGAAWTAYFCLAGRGAEPER